MDCLGGKNPFLKMNCIFINNSPSVQVTTSHDDIDGENVDDVKEEKGVHQSCCCCCCLSLLRRIKRQRR